MPQTCSGTTPAEQAAALEAFRPERYGFRRRRAGWVKEMGGLGSVAVAPLGWPHAHAPSYDVGGDGRRLPTDALSLLVGLQARTWGMPPEDLVPANLLAVLPDTGGAVLVAYELGTGFNVDGWLGFVIGIGSRSGRLVSHMLGVREGVRGTSDLGWSLKLIQGYEALRSGHTTMTWTYDPMRGANARLNIEKLGAEVDALTLDKYGALRSALYGEDVPSDRLTVRWNLTAPATAERLGQVYHGRYHGRTLGDVVGIPDATLASLDHLRGARPPLVRYRIPGNVDRLMEDDPRDAIRWRWEMREVLSSLLPTTSARLDAGTADGPLAVGAQERPGDYVVTGFATGHDGSGERVSYYLLARTAGMQGGGPT